ncbi:MAG: IPT/TIG domain-containing protein [Planctomycetes bacterium]|nr:IPT/TIG domain-containing protein [Planctomycetota bacterium]
MHVPHLHSPFVARVGAAILLAGLAVAQTPAPTASTILPAPSQVLTAFHVAGGTLQEFSLPQRAVDGFQVTVVLDGRTVVLGLNAHDVRAKDYQLLVFGPNGLQRVATPENTTYRGAVVGFPGSTVAASLYGGQLRATLQLAKDQPMWGIQPISRRIPNANPATHLVFSSTQNRVPAARCGVQGMVQPLEPNGPSVPSANMVCEIACDADYRFYVLNGSNVTSTQNDVAAVINGVEAIYKRDVQIEYSITTTIVRTAQVYTSNDAGTLLNQFRSRWLSFHTGVRRDIAHLFTGYGLVGSTIGIAWLSTICDTNYGYGLSESRFSSNYAYRVSLTAHELGHNWSANHCSGSTCNIMCPGLGGCSGNVTNFSSGSIAAIVAFRNSRTCLSPAGPNASISWISPTSVQAFDGGSITMKGVGFTNVTYLYVGTTRLWKLFNQFNVVDDSTITFSSPVPGSLSPTQVWVEDAQGASNKVNLSYTATTPPKLLAPATVKPATNMSWRYGAQPTHDWFLIASPKSTTISALGFTWLSPFVMLSAGKLDAAGYGELALGVPSSTMLGLKFWSQVVTLDSANATFQGNTGIIQTTIQ